jgi:hypothetical protein
MWVTVDDAVVLSRIVALAEIKIIRSNAEEFNNLGETLYVNCVTLDLLQVVT